MRYDLETLEKLKIDRFESSAAVKPRKQTSIFRELIIFVIGIAIGSVGLIYADGRFGLESAFLQFTSAASKPHTQTQQDVKKTVEKSHEAPLAPSLTRVLKPAAPKTILEATGYVRAQRQIHIAPQIGGKIEAIYFDIGKRVEQGDVLASLDNTYAQIEHDQAAWKLELERAVLSETKISLALTQSRLERYILLSNKGLITPQKLQESEAEVAVLKARITAQQQKIKLADANLRLKVLDLEEHLVRAAFSGVVVERFASPGDYISPASSRLQSGSDQGLATLVDTSSIDAIVDVSEKHVSQIQIGQQVIVSGNGADLPDMPGRVSKVIPMVDRGRATVKVLITLKEYNARFLVDMGVRVRFLSSTNPSNHGD